MINDETQSGHITIRKIKAESSLPTVQMQYSRFPQTLYQDVQENSSGETMKRKMSSESLNTIGILRKQREILSQD